MLKNSFKIYYALLLTLLLNNASFAQKYIKGNFVEPLSNIATTNLLPNSSRIDHSVAYTKLKEIYPTTLYKNASELIGEFWLIDGMLINIISNKISPNVKKLDLKAVNYGLSPKISRMKDTPVDMTRFNDYFYEIKVVKNSDVLISYFKTFPRGKTFIIQDKLGKYTVWGNIYAIKTDYTKAHNYINTLINSITFK